MHRARKGHTPARMIVRLIAGTLKEPGNRIPSDLARWTKAICDSGIQVYCPVLWPAGIVPLCSIDSW